MEQYKEDRLGLVLAFWGVGIHLGRPLVSQTDYKEDGTLFGSVLNHVSEGRWTAGQLLSILHCSAFHSLKLFKGCASLTCFCCCIYIMNVCKHCVWY